MEWTEASKAILRALWAQGLSTAAIGREMGISKNAVVGKAHRINLATRPSPIILGGPQRRKRVRTVAPRVTLPKLVSCAGPIPVAPPAPKPVVVPPRLDQKRKCEWPIGTPGTDSFRFCGCLPVERKPYCPDHTGMAYVSIRDKREDHDRYIAA